MFLSLQPTNSNPDQMTIMIESSRTFLFTEYARKICGVIHTQGTDPKAWNKLPDHFSAHPLTKKLLSRVREDKAKQREATDYYHSLNIAEGSQLAASVRELSNGDKA
jgi:homogentisate 1,2-dioxygenase